MSHRKKGLEFSSQLASELEVVLGERARLFDEDAQELAALQDPTHEAMQRLWQQSYQELYFSTPPMQMMLQAEKLAYDFANLDEYQHIYSSNKVMQIDIVEAYAFINPGEGYRFLKNMPENML
jgi:hypothetical protein